RQNANLRQVQDKDGASCPYGHSGISCDSDVRSHYFGAQFVTQQIELNQSYGSQKPEGPFASGATNQQGRDTESDDSQSDGLVRALERPQESPDPARPEHQGQRAHRRKQAPDDRPCGARTRSHPKLSTSRLRYGVAAGKKQIGLVGRMCDQV